MILRLLFYQAVVFNGVFVFNGLFVFNGVFVLSDAIKCISVFVTQR